MLKNTSIKIKITSMILLVSSICIVLALSIVIYINQQDEQKATIENISVLAKLIGNRSNAALSFRDMQLARDNLSSLKSHPLIMQACLYDGSGALFASYIKNVEYAKRCSSENTRFTSQSTGDNFVINESYLLLAEPILLDVEFLGTIEIVASLQVVRENLIRYLLIALFTSTAVGILALLFAARLQGVISTPLIDLSNVAKQVADENDYSIRALKYANDEIGTLVDNFNSMLATIANQNKVLLETSEKANQANAIKSQFLANMSHELRTPINGVIGMNELLLSTELTREQHEYAILASQSGAVLLDTVNQILDLASIESVGLTLKPMPVSMRQFLDDISLLFPVQIATQKLDLVFYIEDSVPAELTFDPVRVRQVFINLITNAIKFTKKGGVIVRIGWQNERLLVSVEDTGIGIPAEAQKRIFESFQQVDNSSTRAFGGTGLGLPISQEICLAMEGQLTIQRSTHAGTVFVFELKATRTNQHNIQFPRLKYPGTILILSEASPLGNWFEHSLQTHQIKTILVHQTDEAIDALAQASLVIVDSKFGAESLSQLIINKADSKQRFIWLAWVGEVLPQWFREDIEVVYKPFSLQNFATLFESKKAVSLPELENQWPYHLLLVDDNAINLKAMKSQLEKAGFNLDTANNGYQAVCACREKHYDLVLMDIQMPEMDGLQATRLIMLEQKQHSPVIIGISAHVMQEHINNAYEAGMSDYLCKPIKEVELISKVKLHLAD